MKKSFLLVLLAGLIFIVTLAAANMKLKTEYTKGHYVNTDIKTILPSFSYIKEDLNPMMNRDFRCNIVVLQSDENSIAMDSTISDLIDFSVENDTLFLRQSQAATKRGEFFYYPVTVSAKQLKGVIARRNQFSVRQIKVNTLQVTAYGKSRVTFTNITVSNLEAYAEKTAGIKIEHTDSIGNATLTLRDRSFFDAENVVFANKTFNLSDSSSLQLSGKSVASFGVK
jgi:hypothetical protein